MVKKSIPSRESQLPGWDTSYKPEELKKILAEYRDVGEEQLWAKPDLFPRRQSSRSPRKSGVRMGMHPDDPPRPIFGLPRICKNRDDLRRLVSTSWTHPPMASRCARARSAPTSATTSRRCARVWRHGPHSFGHLRNVAVEEDGTFYESAHLSSEGSLDMARHSARVPRGRGSRSMFGPTTVA